MKVRYLIQNKYGRRIFSNLEEDEVACIDQINKRTMLIPEIKPKMRCGVIKNAHGAVYAASKEKDYINSAKSFNTILDALANTLEIFHEITKDYQDKLNVSTRHLIHNLTTLNAHNIQEVYSIIPQESLSKNTASSQIAIVEKIVKSETKDTALALLRLAKNNAAMKTEFSVFNKLFDSSPRLEPKSHNVHKVLMNILYLFFPDFTDKHVLVKVNCPENTIAFFDYESIHVALYHLIENAVKYVKPNTELVIDIASENLSVIMLFTMTSIRIYKSEITSIFEEHYSGELAKKTGKSGSGIGMTRAKNILELNGAHLNVVIDESTVHEYFGVQYQTNKFSLELNTRKSPLRYQ